MSLVAYENSDSSEYEDDDQGSCVDVTKKSVAVHTTTQPSTTESEADLKNEFERGLFNALPQPSHKVSSIIEEEDEYLHKKESTNNVLKPKSKITVPSLSDFKDVASTVPNSKPKAENGKKSGLLSILPQPRNGSSLSVTIKSLIPHVLTHKTENNNSSVKKKEPLPTTIKKVKVETDKLVKDYSDDSDDDDVQNDFFSINKPIQIEESPPDDEEIVGRELSTAPVKKEPRSLESYFKKEIENHTPPDSNQSEENEIDVESATSSNNMPTSVSTDNVVLDEEAILKLVGARGKRRREEIQIVDFNQQEVLAEARELLLKGLMDDTSKRVSASKKKGNEPTHMQKRKHQITYLAHQAKANEVELQNKWANNRLSKRQTQSKYGF